MKLGLTRGDFSLYSVQTLHNLYEDDTFTDVTLACEDKKQIKAHKVILSSGSQYFREIFQNNPHSHPLLYLRVPYDHLVSLVTFIYLGQCEVEQSKIDDFLLISKELMVGGLSTKIKDETEANQYLNLAPIPEVYQDISNQSKETEMEPIKPINVEHIDESSDSMEEKDKTLDSGDSKSRNICQICNKHFLYLNSLKEHIEKSHETKTTINITEENESVENESNQHVVLKTEDNIKTSHTADDKNQKNCNLCGYEGFCAAALKVHMNKIHLIKCLDGGQTNRHIINETTMTRRREFAHFNIYIKDETKKTIEDILQNKDGREIIWELFFSYFSSFKLRDIVNNKAKNKDGQKPSSYYLLKLRSSVKIQLSEQYNLYFDHKNPEFIRRWKAIMQKQF